MKPYYQDSFCTIYHGDCLEIMPQLESVDLVVTSPPYNLVREWSGGGPNSNLKRLEERYTEWYPDQMNEKQYQQWQRTVLKECIRLCGGSIFYNHKIRYAWKRRKEIYHPLDWIRDFPIWTEIIWDRCGAQGGNTPRFLIGDERIYQIQKPKTWNGCQGYSTIWRFPPETRFNHVCPFP